VTYMVRIAKDVRTLYTKHGRVLHREVWTWQVQSV